MTVDFRDVYLRDMVRTFRNYKTLGERAMAQVSDADLHTLVDPDANSIALVVKHVAGNLRSRFRDFLTADGEKPDRNRDSEFEMPARAARAELTQWWESAWAVVLASIEALAPTDLDRTVYIRGEAFVVVEALNLKEGDSIEIDVVGTRRFEIKKAPGARELLDETLGDGRREQCLPTCCHPNAAN